MADSLTDTGSLYSAPVGLIYIFNLIVGTGALTMPKAFGEAGWLVSLIAVGTLAFMSYLTATFVIEAMATANAVRRLKHQAALKEGVEPSDPDTVEDYYSAVPDEQRPLLHDSCINSHGTLHDSNPQLFRITERIEMAQMASMFFSRVGRTVFYISLIVYLYGDLAIYGAAVPKSLRDVVCIFRHNRSQNYTSRLIDSDLCWPNLPSINRLQAYRIFLAAFTMTLGPFVFFNIQKTKYLQLFTTAMRWLAFSMMIILSIIYLTKGYGQGHPKIADISKLPNLFGVCVYSFMCHHSLPSLATPIKNKSKLFSLFALDYTLILAFYCILSFTGILTFPNDCLKDLYTLDFQRDNECHHQMIPVTTIAFIQYYLALFPVFTLSTNFPIIAVTLRNNLKMLFYKEGRSYHWVVDRIAFPLAALLPPIGIAFITDNIQFLVGITGSFAGSGIQYFVPASLVLLSRRDMVSRLGSPPSDTKHMSPFRHIAWVVFVFVWAVICVIFIALNHVRSWIHGKWS